MNQPTDKTARPVETRNLLHPEPLVWIHAARALGRLTGKLEQMEGTLLDWVLGESPVLRQRAMVAFASLPAERDFSCP